MMDKITGTARESSSSRMTASMTAAAAAADTIYVRAVDCVTARCLSGMHASRAAVLRCMPIHSITIKAIVTMTMSNQMESLFNCIQSSSKPQTRRVMVSKRSV